MASPVIQADHLWKLLTSNQVKSIDCSVFIDASPRETTLPEKISSQAASLLENIKGRIYPIGLRGKSQAGKSTTLNRIAKISNMSIRTQLPVATKLGVTTTRGIWLMIITFKTEDALLLFDVQGTDRGADEVTHKLIAFTDHVCTKIVDVFRMPVEGFSNEYINALYCLSMGRESVKNVVPTSDKAILWTNCVLPKQSPFDEEIECNTTETYHAELLKCVVGERTVQAEKAKKYTEKTSIFTTSKPPGEILMKIPELENEHPFIQIELVPVMKHILQNVQPVKIASHEINDGKNYMEYLSNVYSSIRKSEIDLPFCALPMIRSIAISILTVKTEWMKDQITQAYSGKSEDIDWISNKLVGELETRKSQCIEQFKKELSDLPEDKWQDQLNDLKRFASDEIQKVVDKFKPAVLQAHLKKQRLELNVLCSSGLKLEDLKSKLDLKKKEIIQKREVPLLHGNPISSDQGSAKTTAKMTSTDEAFMDQALENQIRDLITAQENVERDWSNRKADFEKTIYSSDLGEIDEVIKTMLEQHQTYAKKQFSEFNIEPKALFDAEMMRKQLKQENVDRSKEFAKTSKNDCIAKLNKQIGIVIRMSISVPDKYGKLLTEVENCLRQYYDKLPWPLNNETVDAVNDELQNILKQALDALYTPAVKEQLRHDRIAQVELQTKLNLGENESYLWVYCVGCRRIFAGRTRGCVNVTCCHFTNRQGQNTDHGCGLSFQWAKAQVVKIADLPPELWLSNIEENKGNNHVKTAVVELMTRVRENVSNAPKQTRKRRSSK